MMSLPRAAACCYHLQLLPRWMFTAGGGNSASGGGADAAFGTNALLQKALLTPLESLSFVFARVGRVLCCGRVNTNLKCARRCCSRRHCRRHSRRPPRVPCSLTSLLARPGFALSYLTLLFGAALAIAFMQRRNAAYPRMQLFRTGRQHEQWEAGVAALALAVVLHSLFSFYRAYNFYGHRGGRLPHRYVLCRAAGTVGVTTVLGVLTGLAVESNAMTALGMTGPLMVVVLVWGTSEWQHNDFRFEVPLISSALHQVSAHVDRLDNLVTAQAQRARASVQRTGQAMARGAASLRMHASKLAPGIPLGAAGSPGGAAAGAAKPRTNDADEEKVAPAGEQKGAAGGSLAEEDPAVLHEIVMAAAAEQTLATTGRCAWLRQRLRGKGVGIGIAFALSQLLLIVPCVWLIDEMRGNWGWCVCRRCAGVALLLPLTLSRRCACCCCRCCLLSLLPLLPAAAAAVAGSTCSRPRLRCSPTLRSRSSSTPSSGPTASPQWRSASSPWRCSCTRWARRRRSPCA